MVVERILTKGFFEVLSALNTQGPLRFSQLKAYVHNQRTLSIRLKELSDLGLIEGQGRSYTLTGLGGEFVKLLERLNGTLMGMDVQRWWKPEELDRIPQGMFRGVINSYSKLLLHHFRERLRSLVAFGSIARGAAKINESDIDLLIVVDNWSPDVWSRLDELSSLKKSLEESGEYKALVSKGVWPIFQHYPLEKEEARNFHRIYLDMVFERVVVYDKDGFIEEVLSNVKNMLQRLGSQRIMLPDGSWYWILKPDLKPGEVFELNIKG